ncbi:Outer membrane protein beta-barrel domain-containing protein [Cyclobacterium xiamenense]|uniref:Outer membrane protein beta-barrel domain-containing protein n=1 Tax=Cyclobacterium xiamenense TaxID=1297121 RepID=A0A1H7BLX2_9BACT|nr:porin family protein [Cyclobacterium xiamenense]SEJ75562.1 Outer membrane protein beta-barrel domain-containing protein [Cyclobacterium xiamenense]
MKNLAIVILLTGLFLGEVNGQVLSIGPKFGVSQGDVHVTDGFQGDDSKMGYHLGLFARINLPIIYLQPEVLYTNTGGSFSNNSFNYDVNFDRLDIPVMVGMKLGGLFRFQAGPVASYVFNSDMVARNGTRSSIVPPKEEFTFGYQAGVGIDIGNFLLDLKYEGALTNSINNFAQVPTDQRQNQLIVSMGFRLF